MNCVIKVPSSTANLGCAFDSAGISLSLYNNFAFESQTEDEVVGFRNGNVNDNLVLKSYKKLFEVTKEEYVPVKITMLDCSVPTSRGLGSSATCIVAGVLGANYMLNNKISKKVLLNTMTELESHPDNVAPCFLGGMVCSYVRDNFDTVSFKYNVSEGLTFLAIIPNFELSTRLARKVLPDTYKKQDAIKNLSRTANIGKIFEEGNLDYIGDVFDDSLHVPYRLPLIKGAKEVMEIFSKYGYKVTISGAGPTLLAVGNESLEIPIIDSILGVKWEVKKLKVDNMGAVVK